MMELFPNERPAVLIKAVADLATSGEKERGAIHTRPEVVDLILDLVGYTIDKQLSRLRLLEPSCGNGEFLSEVVRRLLLSRLNNGSNIHDIVNELSRSIKAVELHEGSFQAARERIKRILEEFQVSRVNQEKLLNSWLIKDDFLLSDLPSEYDFVVGNPPYVRQEVIPDELITEYRRLFKTIYDRADLYIPFIEKSLRLLKQGGMLGFICSDRWIKNRYGGPLRKYISSNYWLKYYIDMVDMPAFNGEVSAYPGIFIIKASEKGITRVVKKPSFDRGGYGELMRELTSDVSITTNFSYELSNIGEGTQPWLLDSPEELELLSRIEHQYNKIEEVGCTIGIGVATGADRIFIRQNEELPVEQDRKIPIVLSRDLRTGKINWSGNYVLNPFEEEGNLVEFDAYPKFANYIKQHEPFIKARNVARKNRTNWFRTIDRIYPLLRYTPKLLIPDIKGNANVVFDAGAYYPHHNLYYVTSRIWNIRALQTVLRSSVAEFFIAMYTVRMRGGYLRYQAQYLRRVRIPKWESIEDSMRTHLEALADCDDRAIIDAAVFKLYGLKKKDKSIIERVIFDAERTV